MSEHFRPAAVAGTRPVKPLSENLIFALGLIVGVALAGSIAMFFNAMSDPNVSEGDRICVSMTGEDGQPIVDAYYCGPVVFTKHDDIYRG